MHKKHVKIFAITLRSFCRWRMLESKPTGESRDCSHAESFYSNVLPAGKFPPIVVEKFRRFQETGRHSRTRHIRTLNTSWCKRENVDKSPMAF